MKNMIFYITVIMLSGLMIVVMMNNQEKVSPKVITVSKSYAYHYDSNQSIEIPIYLNQADHPLSDLSSYSMVYIANEDATKKLELDLIKVLEGHHESYLNETYLLYTLIFNMPYLDNLFEIADCFIHIDLINDDSYELMIGTFSLYHIQTSSKNLEWTSLSGMKQEHSFLSRLNKIIIEYATITETIDYIEISPHIETTFELKDNQLIIYIENDNYLLDNVPVIIHYANNEQQVIENFRYIIDYHILKESGMLINLYALN
ncbi:hypothetical protein [Peloplasma aerotolerans]|uniref:Uncharacterized protein n=1 Tax=Peloplasma aerotolerans TaxID=3044389 RepID=A0AAW6UAK8_9MOLU|nr:hypothetical protein [Mariniplasma sp. M4Ah]MDI6451978.1 hypothetical protein [Mariniplasma sp. M4Ah]MDR4968788.1 hypothetical protein [Acholeplasmataceae bacterium]